MPEHKHLLITGQKRSGTTLMANLINAQVKVTVHRDWLMIDRIKRAAGIESYTHLFDYKVEERVRAEHARFCSMLPGPQFRCRESFSSLIEYYLKSLHQMTDTDYVVRGHKATCVPVEDIRELLRLDPQLHVIYMIRDPRDVVASHLKSVRQKRENVFTVAEDWLTATRAIKEFARSDDNDGRLLFVCFEDVMRRRVATLAAIAQFLGLGKVVVPYEMHDNGSVWRGNASDKIALSPLDTRAANRWKKDWRSAYAVRAVLGQNLQAEGYRPGALNCRWYMWRVRCRYNLFRALRRLRCACGLMVDRVNAWLGKI